MRKTENEKRALQLSSRLQPIDYDVVEDLLWEMHESLVDFISYNGSYGVKGGTQTEECYATIINSVDGCNVIRHIKVQTKLRYMTGMPVLNAYEVCQQWFIGNEIVSIARKHNNDFWYRNSKMDLRRENFDFINQNAWNTFWHSESCFIANYEKKGIEKIYNYLISLYGMNPVCTGLRAKADDIFSISPAAEYLKSVGFEALIDQSGTRTMTMLLKYLQSFKVAMRHKYTKITPENINIWLTYVSKLEYLGRDIHNPHYICPENAGQAMQEVDAAYAKKKDKEEQMRKLEEQRKAILQRIEDEKNYKEMYGKFLGIGFATNDGKLHLQVLGSVAEFFDEAQIFKNCIYKCGYFRKSNVLILKATNDDGKRIACIELSLEKMKVVQLRGIGNSECKYHKEIEQSINDNISLFNPVRLAA